VNKKGVCRKQYHGCQTSSSNVPLSVRHPQRATYQGQSCRSFDYMKKVMLSASLFAPVSLHFFEVPGQTNFALALLQTYWNHHANAEGCDLGCV
jgi:hypothetical protein